MTLKPETCGLLVIDAQVYFATPNGRAFQPAATAVVPRIQRLVHLWRERGFKVAFTRHCHEGPHDLGMLGRFFKDYIRHDEPDSSLVPELTPLPSEPVFQKATYDAFFGTDLQGWLQQEGLTQVLIAGMLTQLCCETTARAAFVRGFEVYVVADAMLTSSEGLHVGSLLGLASGVAIVLTTEETEASCFPTR